MGVEDIDIDFGAARGAQLKVLRVAFCAALRRSSLTMILVEELDRDYKAVVEAGSFEEEVFSLLLTAKREGWLNELVQAAVRRFPKAPALRDMVETFALVGSAEPAAAPAARGDADPAMARIMERGGDGAAMPLWVHGLREARLRVGKLCDDQSPRGTGFLVGPDLVLTTGYMLDFIVRKEGGPEIPDARLLFEEERDPDKVFAMESVAHEPSDQRIKVGLASDWLVHREMWDRANYSLSESEIPALPSLDFALLRLNRKIGLEPLANGQMRGWFRLPLDLPADLSGTDILSFHHGGGGDLQMMTGKIEGWQKDGRRFSYRGSLGGGSGGAAILDAKLVPLGMHELGNKGLSWAVRADRIARAIRDAAPAAWKEMQG